MKFKELNKVETVAQKSGRGDNDGLSEKLSQGIRELGKKTQFGEIKKQNKRSRRDIY
jgi:hypothetical protein